MSRSTSDNNKQHEIDFLHIVSYFSQMEVQHFAEAVAEHILSSAELDKIAAGQLNPNYITNNLHQQAGKAAEVKHVARSNTKNIIARNDVRIARTDNVGFPNHEEFDFTRVDKNRVPIDVSDGKLASGSQMKVHKNIDSYRKHFGENYEKYRIADLDIPPDHFDEVMADWQAQKESLESQRDRLRSLGKTELAQEKQNAIDRIDDASSRAKASTVSSEDAMEARVSPKLSVAKDIAGVAHGAGIQAAKLGAGIGGGTSVVRNFIAVYNSKKSIDDAAFAIAKDVGVAATTAYVTAAASTGIGGALQAANNQVMQNLGRSNVPAILVQVTATVGKSVIELAQGRMTSEEFVRNVTKDGSMLAVSMTGANFGAVVGTVVLPGLGTIVGGMVGGMVASMLGGSLHAQLMKSVADLDASNDLRNRTMVICDRLKKQHQAYQLELHAAFDIFFEEKSQQFKLGFDLIASADADGQSIYDGLSCIASAMNKQLAFESKELFSQHIRSKGTLEF